MTYIPQILALGQEEQRIIAHRGNAQRLAEIEAERARLWELQRRLKARAVDVPPEPPKPMPEPIQRLPTLPAGVGWVGGRKPDGRLPTTVRAVVWLARRNRVGLAGIPATPEGIERARRAAEAGRAARDSGETREGIMQAMREAVEQ